MLASDEVEYKKITDFGANFVDPFLIFPVAKLGSLAARAPIVAAQKSATAGATAARSRGLVNVAKVAKTADKGLQKLGKGIDIAGKVGAYPTELASKATAYGLRKGFKGLAGGAGYTLKGIGAVGAATEKVASAPRRAVASLAGKLKGVSEGVPGAAAFGGQVAGAAGGIPGFLELGIAEGVGIMAKKIGREGGELLKNFAAPGSSKRFLYRVATNEKVSPASRKLATIAYDNFGTAIGDGLFNALSNGLTVAGINSGLAGLAGEDAYGSGAAAGSGLVAGGIVPMGPARTQGGKSIAARETQTIDNHMKMKLTEDQRTMFKKLPKSAQVFLATLQEANIGAPKFLIMEDKAYLTMLNKDRESKGLDLLDRAPAGHFNKESKTVFLNENRINKSAQVGLEITAHETGHAFLHEALGNDPTMLQLLLEGYKTTEDKGTPFYFQYDMEGNPVGDPIYLNDQAVQIATDYSRKQKGIDIGRNASKLAQEIGADQFAMMFSKNPNVFEQFHPRLRRMLIDSTRRLLTAVGIAEPVTGNPLTNPISKIQLNSPVLKRLYRNYGKARALELDEKGNLAENGMQITPKKGQTGEDRYTELFGGQGLSLRDAKNLAVTNKSLNRELQNLKKKYKDEPADTWSVTKNGKFVGKNLLPDLRTIFTRNDPFGNVANILDALQEAITQRIGIRFGYRSGTKGKYQNPFRIRDVAIYGYEVSGRDRPNLKVLGYDQAVVRNNIQVLVEKGYIKDQADFMRQLEDQGQKALEDPEGRINPEGRKENELMTVAFGLKESAGNIASPGLRDLLESKAVKKSFRSYDVEALAGLTKGRNKAFAFDYNNIRDNYNPFRQSDENLYQPTEIQEGPGSPFRRKSQGNIASKTRNFKSSVMLKDGARLSGIADNDKQDPFIGFDKNNQPFSQRREFIKPEDIVGSKDNDKTANLIRRELETGDLFIPTEEADLEFQISTRNPTAGNRTEDPVASNLVITLNDILEAPGVAESYAKAVNRYPGFKASRAKPETVIAKFVDMVESNLLHLYDSVEPEIRERSKLWYVGARKIALEYAEKYGFSPQAVAATMAATSPQTDWYKNVDRARRILETVKDEQDTVYDEAMAKKTISTASKTDKPSITAITKTMVGKAFKDLNKREQAYFIRAFDELNRDRSYQIISPEGDFIGPALKDNGEIDKYSWLSYGQITKALSALADDSKANISNVMGEAHKIRNFYNNILLPFMDKDAVTIDTHAVAAGLLRPLASKDLEVANMLGAKPTGKQHVSIKNSSIAGISGLYGVYAEAYRRAAKARGVLPREMQSITWEAIRGLYPKEIKQPKFKQQINDLFKQYENGKISIDELRAKIFDKAGGIDPPSWAEGNNTPGENRPRGSGDSQQGRASSDEGQLFRPSVRGLGTRDRPRGVRDSSARATPSGVNRFLAPAAVAAGGMELPERFR
jgi:Zn-dependent peptidase ImmA (M78 family)